MNLKKNIFFLPTLIKMGNGIGTTQESGLSETGNKQYVSVGLVTLVSVLIVIVIFIVMGCKLKCGKTRENYWRTSSSNDTQGTGYGYQGPVDFAGPADKNISWKDSPHWIAEPDNKYLPLDMAGVDLYKTQRRLTENFETDPNNPNPPLFEPFGQYYAGERASMEGNLMVGEPWTNNIIKSRWDYRGRATLPTARSLNNQPQQGHLMPLGMDYNQRLNNRKFDQLFRPSNAPNARVLPVLKPYNKEMSAVIRQDQDITI